MSSVVLLPVGSAAMGIVNDRLMALMPVLPDLSLSLNEAASHTCSFSSSVIHPNGLDIILVMYCGTPSERTLGLGGKAGVVGSVVDRGVGEGAGVNEGTLFHDLGSRVRSERVTSSCLAEGLVCICGRSSTVKGAESD